MEEYRDSVSGKSVYTLASDGAADDQQREGGKPASQTFSRENADFSRSYGNYELTVTTAEDGRKVVLTEFADKAFINGHPVYYYNDSLPKRGLSSGNFAFDPALQKYYNCAIATKRRRPTDSRPEAASMDQAFADLSKMFEETFREKEALRNELLDERTKNEYLKRQVDSKKKYQQTAIGQKEVDCGPSSPSRAEKANYSDGESQIRKLICELTGMQKENFWLRHQLEESRNTVEHLKQMLRTFQDEGKRKQLGQQMAIDILLKERNAAQERAQANLEIAKRYEQGIEELLEMMNSNKMPKV